MKIFRDEYKEDRTWLDWKMFSGLHTGERFYKVRSLLPSNEKLWLRFQVNVLAILNSVCIGYSARPPLYNLKPLFVRMKFGMK